MTTRALLGLFLVLLAFATATRAAAAEAAAELAAASLNGGGKAANGTENGEDIDERGWLPK